MSITAADDTGAPATGAPRTGRAAPLSRDDRRKAIIAATIPLLIEHGEAVTTRAIAEAAGIAEGTIFRVFPDKNALLLAAAEETLNPSEGRADLAEAVLGIDDLREMVRVVTERMFVRAEQVSTVLMSLRRVWMAQVSAGHHRPGGEEAPHGDHAKHDGPPAFIVESHRKLHERLTEVFEPYADELAVAPERAALMLRTLVLGSRHPGMQPADRLSVEEVVGLLLDGIHRPGEGRS